MENQKCKNDIKKKKEKKALTCCNYTDLDMNLYYVNFYCKF